MEFTPFKPVAQVITFVEKPNNAVENGNGTATRSVKDQTLLRKPKPIIGFRLSKYAFVEKHNLRELKTDASTFVDGISYYYEQKSRTVFELNNAGPVVFMKTDLEKANYLIKLNDL
jgi:hypothetical protein